MSGYRGCTADMGQYLAGRFARGYGHFRGVADRIVDRIIYSYEFRWGYWAKKSQNNSGGGAKAGGWRELCAMAGRRAIRCGWTGRDRSVGGIVEGFASGVWRGGGRGVV